MPSAVRGAASPWFTGAGSDLMVVKVSVKYLMLQLADHGQTNNRPVFKHQLMFPDVTV